MTVAAAKPLAEILEDDWDSQLFRGPKALATLLGWTSYHTLRSRGSRSGYPDRTLVRDRVIFAELKRETTRPTPDQRDWLDKLARAGGEVYLWRPSDLHEIARILGGRSQLVYDGDDGYPIGLSKRDEPWWQPGSLWIPGVGRADTTEQRNPVA